MYFNKTRSFVAFGLSSVDLQLPSSLPLTPGTALDAEPRPRLPAGGRRRILIYTSTHERIRRLSVNVLTDLFNLLIFHSLSSFFFSSSLFPSINVKKGKQTSAKSTHILFCMSVHYIILSSLQAPMLPSYGQPL